MKKLTIIFLCFSIIFTSCTNLFNSDKNVAKKLNLSNAKFLVLKQDKTDASTMYKIVEKDGKYVEEKATILNADGKEIESEFAKINVKNVYAFNNEFICLYGEFKISMSKDQDEAKDYTCLLIRVSDGAIFDFEGYFPWYSGPNKSTQFDNDGNIYFNAASGLNKLISNSSGVKVETYLPNCGNGFHIAGNGDCYYSTGSDIRVKKASGGILINNTIKLPIGSGYYRFEPYLYLSDNQDNVWCSSFTALAKIKKTDSDIFISDTIYSDINIGEPASQFIIGYSNKDINYGITFPNWIYPNEPLGLFIDFNEAKSYFLQIPNLLVGTYKSLQPGTIINNTFYTIVPEQLTTLFAIDLTKYEKASETTYNLTSFKKINFPTNLENITYQISNENEILFQGFRPSDEMNITGIISADYVTTILTTSKSSNYTNLTRLN